MKISASYSTVCENELLLKLLPQYLIEKPEKCQFWQRGVNDTYRITSSEKVYSLRVYRHNLRTKSEIDFEIAALNYLAERGASVAYPFAKKEGGYVSEIHAPEGLRYAVITSHAYGSVPEYSSEPYPRLFGVISDGDSHLVNTFDNFGTLSHRQGVMWLNALDVAIKMCRLPNSPTTAIGSTDSSWG